MALEIERKFLVNPDLWESYKMKLYEDGKIRKNVIRQGYLNRDPKRTVRVRIEGQKGILTIKGMTEGITRPEFEYPIPYEDAEKIFDLCDGKLDKVRYSFVYGVVWTVDEFLGDNEGLIIAEVELEDDKQEVKIPDFLNSEVSDDPKYFNSNLISLPYNKW